MAVPARLWLQTGLRAGEVLGLQVQDFDPERGTVSIERQWTRQRIGPPKTRQSRRTVAITHPTTEATALWRPGSTPESRHILERLRAKTCPDTNRACAPQAFIFGGVTPLAHSVVNRRWHLLLDAARVRYRSPEQNRHTFASTLLSRGAPLLYVQRAGGWKSATVLLGVYARYVPSGFDELPPTGSEAGRHFQK
jgi:integrase